MAGPALFLLSASLLAFEIVLLRIFSIESFHHFAYMAVGVALLGFGASGTILVLLRRFTRDSEWPLFLALLCITPLALLIAPILAHLPRFDPTQLLWDPGQWWSLAAVYGALALPFLVGAGAVALSLQGAREGVGRLYAWNLAGSGMGAFGAIPLLFLLPPDRALAWTVVPVTAAAVAALLVFPSACFTHVGSMRRGRVAAALLLVAVTTLALIRPPTPLRVIHFKGLPQVEAYADARRIGERWAPTGWSVAVEAPAFRHAPGLSLAYRGEIPRQVALFVDGQVAGAVTAGGPAGATGTDGVTTFLDWLPSAAPYALGPQGSVLIVGSAGGLEVLNALQHGAHRVTGVELVGSLTALARQVASGGETARGIEPAGFDLEAVYQDPRVTLVTGDARSFAARSNDRFTLVALPLAGAFNAAAAGIHSGGEDFLNTVESYRSFLDLLEPGGVLAVTRWLRVPPRDNVRLILMGGAALRALEVEDVGGSMAFMRSWATGTLLLKPDGFSTAEIDRLRVFSQERLFDVDWPPSLGIMEPEHNILAEPVFRDAVHAAATGEGAAQRFAQSFPFNVHPATDSRPYFGRFLRLRSLPALLRRERGGWLPFAEWGYLTLMATLVQSGLLAVVLIGLPAVAVVRSRSQTRSPLARPAVYFAGVGFGFILVEMAAIQRLSLLLGHPVYAAALTLGALLAFSGVGSALSDRLPGAWAFRTCIIVMALAVLLAALSPLSHHLAPFPTATRAAAALFVLACAGLMMGAPFPIGLRLLASAQGGVAWAWGVNGVASVLGASLAMLLAMEGGAQGVFLIGAVCYLGAGLAAAGIRSKE